MSRNAVHSIAQTPDGFLWLGTSAGLARFDGSQFKIFSPYTTPSVPPGTIKGLFVDSRGRIWIGSLGGRISMMEHGELVEIDVSSVSAYGVLHFAEDNGGRIWVAADGGLFYVDGRKLVNDPAKAGPNVRSATVGIDSDSGDVYTCYWESLVHWAEGGKTLVYTDQPQRRLMSQSIYPRKVLRAIENRVTVVRSSNSGVSGFWSPTGASYGIVTNARGQTRSGMGAAEREAVAKVMRFRKQYQRQIAINPALRETLSRLIDGVDQIRSAAAVEGVSSGPVYSVAERTIFSSYGHRVKAVLIGILVLFNLMPLLRWCRDRRIRRA